MKSNMAAENAPEKFADVMHVMAEGEAGLWLSESLILALLESGVLDTETILEAIEVVISAKKAHAKDGGHPDISRAAAAHLAAFSASVSAAKTGTAIASARRNPRKPKG